MLTVGTWKGHLEVDDRHAQGCVCSLFFPMSSLKTRMASSLCGVGSCTGCRKQYSWASLCLSDRGSSRPHTERWPHFYNSCGKAISGCSALWQKPLSLRLSLSVCVRKGSLGHPTSLRFLDVLKNERKQAWLMFSEFGKEDYFAIYFLGSDFQKDYQTLWYPFSGTYAVCEFTECPKCWRNWWYDSEIRECRGAVILK